MLLETIFCRMHVEEETEGDDDATTLVDWVVSCVRSERMRDLISHDSKAMKESRSFERTTMVEESIEVRIPLLVETDNYLQLHG